MRKVLLLYVKQAILLFLFTTTISSLFAQPDVGYSTVISSGLSAPMEVATAPGDASGRLFIVEKAGRIRIWNGTALLPTPFLDISGLVADDGERGLLSMVFHPNYAANGFFFVYYNANSGNITVARYQVSADPNIANSTPNPAAPLVSIPKNFTNHNGGHLQFKPGDATPYLYFATGDGGSGNDPDNNAQNQSVLLGKMIRMNVDAPTPTPEIWAWGLRNPFRWSFDRSTGDIWIGDVGQGQREEVDFRAAGTSGANYGWPCMEGTLVNGAAPGAGDCDTVTAVDILPVFQYNNPAQGRSIVGGYVYRGSEYPAMQGYYLVTDFYTGTLWLIRPDGIGGWTVTSKSGLPTGISSISEIGNGALYVTSLNANTVAKVIDLVVTPVRLLAFSGKPYRGYNELKWTIETESAIDRYIVEYSTDGVSYQYAGEIMAANNPQRSEYSFRHSILMTGKLFYRLRINETDGRREYSPVISVGAAGKDGLQVYPTIVTNGSVNIIAEWPVQKVNLLAADGRLVYAKDMNGFFPLGIPALPKGMYLLQVTGKDMLKTEKIFIR